MGKRILKAENIKLCFIVLVSSFLLILQLLPSAAVLAESEETQDEYITSLQETFDEFVETFDVLEEEQINDYIDKLQLYADDERVLRSTIEEVDVSEKENNDSVESIITYLIELREKNIALAESNPSIENRDLEGIEDLEESLDSFNADEFQSQSELYGNAMRTFSIAEVNRLYGSTRFETATQISGQRSKTSNTVVIADGTNYADALAGVPLATALDAPILLHGNTAGNQTTLEEVQRLGATHAVILGGEVAVSSSFENQLQNLGLSTERIAGERRYDTAALIAEEVVSRTGSNEAILVSGEDFADALSIASFAAKNGHPIYLSRQSSLPESVDEVKNDYDSWLVIGGEVAIDGPVAQVLRNAVGGDNFQRIRGANRYETNRRIFNHYGVSNHTYVATGQDFADALTGAVLAAHEGSSIMLVSESTSVLEASISYASRYGITQYTILGGEVAVSSRIEETLRNYEIPREKPLIVIDPGHGGSDTGANYGGVQEKNLNLSTARYLHDILVASGNYEVVMTRTSDVAVVLGDRPQIANNLDADIFISIHYNAMGGANAGAARGIETFVQNFGYITDRNQFNTSDPRIRESLQLADAVHPLLISRTGLNNRGIRGQNLNVLRNTNMPAILVELGFIDNPTERNFVNTQSYRSNASHAMKDGIDRYFGN